ncbi:hypothetical protein FQZ97_1152510 [compost metagenome]
MPYSRMSLVSIRANIGIIQAKTMPYPMRKVLTRPILSDSQPPTSVKISQPKEARVVASSTGGAGIFRTLVA